MKHAASLATSPDCRSCLASNKGRGRSRASVEYRDNAIYHIVCSTEALALAHDPYPSRLFRKTDAHLFGNSQSISPLRHC